MTAIGSDEEVSVAYYDAGLLSTVLDAYNNHFVLRTSPDDWWATIITTISLAIDDNAKKPQVRDFFVAHQGKKTLSVVVSYLHFTFIAQLYWLKMASLLNLNNYFRLQVCLSFHPSIHAAKKSQGFKT